MGLSCQVPHCFRGATSELPRNVMLSQSRWPYLGYSREHNNGLVYGFWQQTRDYSNGFGPFVNRNHFAGWMLMAISRHRCSVRANRDRI